MSHTYEQRNKDYYTEWDALSQDVEDLAEYVGVDISNCESPNEICALVLAEMKKRLMPDGCEWPRFEDGTPVRFGDKFLTDRGNEGTAYRIEFLERQTNIWPFEGSDIGIVVLTSGERVKRPAPKMLDSDRRPINVGDTVYETDCTGRVRTLLVKEVGRGFLVTTDEGGGAYIAVPDNGTLTHEKPVDTWDTIHDALMGLINSVACDAAEHRPVGYAEGNANELLHRAKKLGGGANEAR